jgi:hypothetical protein
MTTHYRDDQIVVTSAYLRINDRTWQLSELDYVWHRQITPDWRVRGRTASRGLLNILMILAGLAGAVVLIAVLSSAYIELKITPIPKNTLLVVAILLLIMGFVPLIWEWALTRVDDSYDKGDAIYEMWATIHGAQILLLRLPDATRFSRIYRGLQRALEETES